MKWAVKAAPRDPDLWAERTVRRFAWFPMLVDAQDDPPIRVWLEHYYAYQEYGYSRDGYGGYAWYTVARYSADPLWEQAV